MNNGGVNLLSQLTGMAPDVLIRTYSDLVFANSMSIVTGFLAFGFIGFVACLVCFYFNYLQKKRDAYYDYVGCNTAISVCMFVVVLGSMLGVAVQVPSLRDPEGVAISKINAAYSTHVLNSNGMFINNSKP